MRMLEPGPAPPTDGRGEMIISASTCLAISFLARSRFALGRFSRRSTGSMAIARIWAKFFGAQGPLAVDLGNVQVKDDDGKQTVAARTIFERKPTVLSLTVKDVRVTRG